MSAEYKGRLESYLKIGNVKYNALLTRQCKRSLGFCNNICSGEREQVLAENSVEANKQKCVFIELENCNSTPGMSSF